MIYLNCNMSMSAVLLGGSVRPESIAQMEKGTLYQSDRWMDRQPWQPLPLPASLMRCLDGINFGGGGARKRQLHSANFGKICIGPHGNGAGRAKR